MVYDAVVVGGGMAGLTSAAYLSQYGYHTLLCEKSAKTGGLVNTFWHQGFAFDAGIRAFENSGILIPMLKSLGIQLDCTRDPVSIGIADQWTRLRSRESLQDYATMLTRFFPDHLSDISRIADAIKQVMVYMDVLYGIDNPLFRDNMHDREYLMKTLLPWLLSYQVNIRKAMRLDEPVLAYLLRLTENQALIDLIAQHFFKNTPTFFALSYFGQYLDYCYPVGGTGVLADKVTDSIRLKGGEIKTQTSVSHVDATHNQIQTDDGATYHYKKLIWAADQKTLYASVGSQPTRPMIKQRELTEQGSGGDSILTVFAGVNLPGDYFASRCGAHAFYTPSSAGLSSLAEWQVALAGGQPWQPWLSQYLERTTYELSCPALRDASLAPEGMTGIMISTLMDYRLVRKLADQGDYAAFKAFCTQKMIDVLDATAFPGIRDHILFTICATPLTIERETGNAQGAITGWAFADGKMPAINRLTKIAKSIQTPIQDTYQCGQWTFSPSGLPVSILTGKLAADAVRKALGEAKNPGSRAP